MPCECVLNNYVVDPIISYVGISLAEFIYKPFGKDKRIDSARKYNNLQLDGFSLGMYVIQLYMLYCR